MANYPPIIICHSYCTIKQQLKVRPFLNYHTKPFLVFILDGYSLLVSGFNFLQPVQQFSLNILRSVLLLHYAFYQFIEQDTHFLIINRLVGLSSIITFAYYSRWFLPLRPYSSNILRDFINASSPSFKQFHQTKIIKC